MNSYLQVHINKVIIIIPAWYTDYSSQVINYCQLVTWTFLTSLMIHIKMTKTCHIMFKYEIIKACSYRNTTQHTMF